VVLFGSARFSALREIGTLLGLVAQSWSSGWASSLFHATPSTTISLIAYLHYRGLGAGGRIDDLHEIG